MSLKPPSPGTPGFNEWRDLADAVDAAGVLGAGRAPDPQGPELVPMPTGWRHDIESAIRSLRYGAHPHRSPHADDLQRMLENIDLTNMKAELARREAAAAGVLGTSNEQEENCAECDGSGMRDSLPYTPCLECNGIGKVITDDVNPSSEDQPKGGA